MNGRMHERMKESTNERMKTLSCHLNHPSVLRVCRLIDLVEREVRENIWLEVVTYEQHAAKYFPPGPT